MRNLQMPRPRLPLPMHDKAAINTRQVLDLNSGTFTVTQKGIYAFSISLFQRMKESETYSQGYIYKNGNSIYHLLDANSVDRKGQNFAYFWLVELAPEDKIKVTGNRLDASDANPGGVFNGFLLSVSS